jgi:hypothetical protein
MIFIMGEFGTVEDYVHITGRTGRRRPATYGTVVTILEDTTENLGQKLLNSAVKLVRTGAKSGEWKLPDIEMDLKALPGDEFEEIRNKGGIVTVTDEVRQKEERERRTVEEQKKWLLMQGVDDEELNWKDKVEDVVGDKVERPEAFAMKKSSDAEKEVKPVTVDSASIDWKEALAQSLRESSNGTQASEEQDVIVGNVDPIEDIETLQDEEIICHRAVEPTPVDLGPLPPFASKPPFPVQQYKAAWKGIKIYYDKAREEKSAEIDCISTESAVTAESMLFNQAVLPEDTPVLSHDMNINAKSNQNVENMMEGGSLCQVEESHLPPKPNTKKLKQKKVGEKKSKRGRPRKDTKTIIGA